MINPVLIITVALLLGVFALPPASAQSPQIGTEPKVSQNGHFLTHRDGKPFFYLADTAWELFARLNREEVIFWRHAEKGMPLFTVHRVVPSLSEWAKFPGARYAHTGTIHAQGGSRLLVSLTTEACGNLPLQAKAEATIGY